MIQLHHSFSRIPHSMKKSLFIVLLAGCVSFLSAQDRTTGENPDLQKELKTLHSTIKALQRSQILQKKTFNILASQLDSLQSAVRSTQGQTAQVADSMIVVSKIQAAHAQRIDSLEVSLETRTILFILALVAMAALSLVIFFTLKKAIVEASEVLRQQIPKQASFEVKKHEAKAVSALIVESAQKKTAITLPIEPELFEAAKHAAAAEAPAARRTDVHVAIAEMIAPAKHDEKPAAHETPARAAHTPAAQSKAAAHCHGVTKTGSQCKRKPVTGTKFCSQHAA
jgi:hypothetical protein